jgi:Carboxylesterase family
LLNLRFENAGAVKSQADHHPRPRFQGRRSLIGRGAALGAGLAGSRILLPRAAPSFRRAAWEQVTSKAGLRGAPAYPYIYAWRTPVLDGRPGPFHGAELAFTFDGAELCHHYRADSTEAIVLSKRISTAWLSAARTGNPHHDELPQWPQYSSGRRAEMRFDTPCEVRLRLISGAPQFRAHTAPATGSP